jgi:hypothetical protein
MLRKLAAAAAAAGLSSCSPHSWRCPHPHPLTQVTNEAVLKQSTNQAQLATDTQTATLPCPQALLTNSVSYVKTRNWYW